MALLDDIHQWSTDLPAWQRDALRRLFQSARLSANDIQELIAMVNGPGSTTFGRTWMTSWGSCAESEMPIARNALPRNQGAVVPSRSMIASANAGISLGLRLVRPTITDDVAGIDQGPRSVADRCDWLAPRLIHNPGYTHDRGPARFARLRIHLEY